ncbi:dynein 18 kDa light chain, flagellar outer arm protein (macronuclear) [Tetrahymena thermophila SB210]|uniref:Calmodulin n=1 Tax=Tetrahymena thermophila (strain SB210) TaxID=312017 RepID=I7M9Q9_TETTS|nr:dynein 18 kDa light chain, flagellar outer arm protein [Tetrahymena thermophila SB210]EAS02635.2 dynein 18 kDa light chain, flagellar outer arm protein [Tetrahymena thermophila SB210]|eukprot:XP_001022880.2 dynein 18 kDa light chain, flagellar outer arm protein [Tetrahymena thermophila SB210]
MTQLKKAYLNWRKGEKTIFIPAAYLFICSKQILKKVATKFTFCYQQKFTLLIKKFYGDLLSRFIEFYQINLFQFLNNLILKLRSARYSLFNSLFIFQFSQFVSQIYYYQSAVTRAISKYIQEILMSLSLKQLRDVDINILTKKEIDKCQEAFTAFDKNGSKFIEKEELKKVLEEMGQSPQEEELIKMINEVDQTGKGAISFDDFLTVIAYYKQLQQNSDEEDIILAFVALGGNEDKTGSIDRKLLQEVISSDFSLTIDLNRLVKELSPATTEVKYEDFKNLLSN